jgi:hypothetical protein
MRWRPLILRGNAGITREDEVRAKFRELARVVLSPSRAGHCKTVETVNGVEVAPATA